jgi:hypothetical protein
MSELVHTALIGETVSPSSSATGSFSTPLMRETVLPGSSAAGTQRTLTTVTDGALCRTDVFLMVTTAHLGGNATPPLGLALG